LRAVSEILGLIIVVGVVVATSIAVSLILSTFMSRQVPAGADLSVSITYARLKDGNLYIKGVLIPVGKEPLNVTGIEAYKGRTAVSSSSVEQIAIPATLIPGNSYEFEIVLRSVSGVATNDKITVVVSWTTRTGQTGASAASATVSA